LAEHVADTSALSYLFRADALDLLRLLFGTILVPTDVEAELRVGREQGCSLPDPLAMKLMVFVVAVIVAANGCSTKCVMPPCPPGGFDFNSCRCLPLDAGADSQSMTDASEHG
jgi:hypothetical protein